MSAAAEPVFNVITCGSWLLLLPWARALLSNSFRAPKAAPFRASLSEVRLACRKVASSTDAAAPAILPALIGVRCEMELSNNSIGSCLFHLDSRFWRCVSQNCSLRETRVFRSASRDTA